MHPSHYIPLHSIIYISLYNYIHTIIYISLYNFIHTIISLYTYHYIHTRRRADMIKHLTAHCKTETGFIYYLLVFYLFYMLGMHSLAPKSGRLALGSTAGKGFRPRCSRSMVIVMSGGYLICTSTNGNLNPGSNIINLCNINLRRKERKPAALSYFAMSHW